MRLLCFRRLCIFGYVDYGIRKFFIKKCFRLFNFILNIQVMVVVHERVPDSKRYPPLPDIFLDNVPHIGWAFWACEVTGAMLFAIWVCVLVFHKYR